MVSATRADALVLVELLVVEHLLAAGTLRPQVGRMRLATTTEWQLDRHQVRTLRQANTAAPAMDMPDAMAAPPISKLRSGSRGTGSVRGITAMDTIWPI